MTGYNGCYQCMDGQMFCSCGKYDKPMMTIEEMSKIASASKLTTIPDQNQKRDAGKTDPMMFDEDLALAKAMVTRVLDYGKEKYGTRGGWMQVSMDRYESAEARHRQERLINGRMNKDSETNLPHIAHQITNLMFVLETELRNLSPAQLKKAMTYNPPPKV